jgi:tetratricopeptide (TPR) repeat protein
VYSKASFWTKKAWASDAGRDEETRNAAQAYTRAIRLDSNFLQAYEHRAGDYLNLKRYPEALNDYEKILALDADNTTAYSDRGLARFETGAYVAAISDFGEAIRLKKSGDSYLLTLITRMKPPSFERLCRFSGSLPIACKNIRTSDKNFAIFSKYHFNAGNCRADAPGFWAIRVIHRTDRSGLA